MSKRMLKLRKSFNLTQEDLAEKINTLGILEKTITQQQISNIERGYSNTSIPTAKAIAEVLKTTIDDLF